MMIEETAPLTSSPNYYNINDTPQSFPSPSYISSGTILEAAFIDPAYSWPPQEGVGKNAFEVIASRGTNSTDDDLSYPELPNIKSKRKIITEREIVTTGRCFGGFFKCCRSDEAVVRTNTETIPVNAEQNEKLKREYLQQRDMVKKKRRERKMMLKDQEKKYALVPDGVLVYRLDTAQKTIQLISAPNSNTDMKNLMTEMKVVDAVPSRAANRKGIMLTGDNGEVVEIVACEQRTATSWMEALNMMLGKDRHGMRKVCLNVHFLLFICHDDKDLVSRL